MSFGGSGAGQPGPGVLRDLRRLSLFAFKRLLALFVTVVIGVYLTIFIANLGGQVDELRLAQIRATISEQVRGDPGFMDLAPAERNTLVERQIQLEVERLRLDQPFIVRSVDYLQRAILLDLGRAEQMHSDAGARDVYAIIVERLPATLLLFGTANVLVFFVSVFVALSLSRRYGSPLDRAVIALAPSSAAPGWFYGIFLILLFAFVVPILPSGGMVRVPPPDSNLEYALSVLRHMTLPVIAMFVASIFISIYSWRTFFLIHSSEDYVEMARAKGLPPRMIERRYILRPTLSPIITSFALMLIGLWSGAIILEQVFNWPGLGTLLFQAIGHRDTPVIIGSVVIFAYQLALTVFLLDFLYALIDPREITARPGPGFPAAASVDPETSGPVRGPSRATE
jgi:peptide/nickel transport system permease protein